MSFKEMKCASMNNKRQPESGPRRRPAENNAGALQDRIQIGDDPLQQALSPFLAGLNTPEEKTRAIESALAGGAGKFWREELGKWTVRMVPAELLVPEVHRHWRPLVRDAMLFVVARLSATRLAPKIVEQSTLPRDTPPEVRLLKFIAKVPGLQKIGQVLARNRNLDPKLRRALIKLENGISDMSIADLQAMIREQIKSQIKTYKIKVEPAILSEASVSAVVGFTWRNPQTHRRERGVFKILKPHIPGYFAEDMKILGQLARHLARKHKTKGTRLGGLAETLTEIRLLLEHEVDFRREQATLASALSTYRSIPGVRVPRLIPLLSTPTITALSFERGKKVTETRVRPVKLRALLAERLAEALIAAPVMSLDKNSVFHADPHAGNVLYDRRRNELVILDWALTERLTQDQRKNVVLMVMMMALRDADGLVSAIAELCQVRPAYEREEMGIIRAHVERRLDELTLTQLPGPLNAMMLLDEIAMEGIRFPAALLMFRKAFFTLEGVMEDVAGTHVRLDTVMARYALAHWEDAIGSLLALFTLRDWAAVDWSALTLTSRLLTIELRRRLRLLAGLSAAADAA
jgi:ubiquinone biosynthesis protein